MKSLKFAGISLGVMIFLRALDEFIFKDNSDKTKIIESVWAIGWGVFYSLRDKND